MGFHLSRSTFWLCPTLALLLSSTAHAQLEWGTYSFDKQQLASDGVNQDYYGMALDVSGDRAVVAAPRKSVGAGLDGQIYVYARNLGGSNNWGELYKLASPIPAIGELFGSAVALSSTTLVVGAPGHDSATSDTGIVYYRDAPSGAPLGTFANPDPLQFLNVGRALAIDGGEVIVGADRRLFAPFYQPFIGAAFLTDATGTLLHTLAASDGATGHNFGMAVAIGGGYCAVGARNANGAVFNSGAVYVYDTATGLQLHKLIAPAGLAFEEFGASLSIDAGKLLVGAPNHFIGSGLSGEVFLFDLATGALDVQFSPPPGGGFRFGNSVALADGKAYIGDLYSISSFSGRVWQIDLGYGSATCEYQDSRMPKVSGFAESLAADGTTIFTGSTDYPYASGLSGKRGAAFVMERQELGLGTNLDQLFASQDQAILKLHGGKVAAPCAFVLTKVNGTPTFTLLTLAAFSPVGKYNQVFPPTPSLAGLTIEVTGGGIDQTGGLSFTNPRVMQFF